VTVRIYSASDVGRIIKDRRISAGLTQAEVAEMAGINRSYLSELEAGATSAQVERLVSLLKLLGLRLVAVEADW